MDRIFKKRMIDMAWVGHLFRFLVASLVLLFVGFLVPGFAIHGFSTAVLTAAIITALGWILESLFGLPLSPYGRGLIGFSSTAVVIYLTQFIIKGVTVTIIGALLASLLIGIIDLFLPSRARYWGN